MCILETGPAPFMPGDRVIYRPRPTGIETVALVECRSEGWAAGMSSPAAAPTPTTTTAANCSTA
jgi:hypothetical protein